MANSYQLENSLLKKNEYNKNPNKCKFCGKPILASKDERLVITKSKDFCSLQCRVNKRHNDKIDIYNANPKICIACGKPIYTKKYSDIAGLKNHKFCSLECSYQNRDMSKRKNVLENNKINRVGKENINTQGYSMKCIKYNCATDILVEFQDKYHEVVHSTWQNFKNGTIDNHYAATIQGVGITGVKYGTNNKEYTTWTKMLYRCFDQEYKQKNPTYKEIICCNEWLLYENFYDWLHSQDNFDRWINMGYYGNLDKDILVKGNKVYSPETCVLVPHNINKLFIRKESCRNELPIGVSISNKRTNAKDRYAAVCNDGDGNSVYLGNFTTIDEAFYRYKHEKEKIIKQIAQQEFDKGNITKRCYDAMMNYEIEITD